MEGARVLGPGFILLGSVCQSDTTRRLCKILDTVFFGSCETARLLHLLETSRNYLK